MVFSRIVRFATATAYACVIYHICVTHAFGQDSLADTSLLPVSVNFTPGPKYADTSRLFQGIPGIEQTGESDLWATWYGGGLGEGGDNYVIVARSADRGRTWSAPYLTIDPPGEVRAFDPCLWQDPKGRLWLFWAQSFTFYDGRAGVWFIRCDNPNDAVPHWTAPIRIANGVMMNKPTVMSSGEWVFPIAVWSTTPPFLSSMNAERTSSAYVSNDNGQTFTRVGGALYPNRSFDEHIFVERNDGAWMLLNRLSGGRGIGVSISVNRGRTWSSAGTLAVQHCDSRFYIRRLRSGRLLLIHNDSASNRTNLVARLSEDDGKTWIGNLLIDERDPVSYPDATEGPDGYITVIYDYSRTSSREITTATFCEADIIASHRGETIAPLVILVNKSGPQEGTRILKPLRPQAATSPAFLNLSATVSGDIGIAFEWLKDGSLIAVTDDPVFAIAAPGLKDSGLYLLRVRAPGKQVLATGDPVMINITEPVTGAARMTNLSTRCQLAADHSALLHSGFVIAGDGEAKVVVRGVGPSLEAFGIRDFATNPYLMIGSGLERIVRNVDADEVAAATMQVGAFPLRSDLDAHVQFGRRSGSETISMGNSGNSNGEGLLEVYINEKTSKGVRLLNLSSRARVGPTAPMFAGFVLSGARPSTVLIRAIGASLGQFGIEDAGGDPEIALFQSDHQIDGNDNWESDARYHAIKAATARAGAFIPYENAQEAAILRQLLPGAYTAIVTTATEGQVLLEIYVLE